MHASASCTRVAAALTPARAGTGSIRPPWRAHATHLQGIAATINITNIISNKDGTKLRCPRGWVVAGGGRGPAGSLGACAGLAVAVAAARAVSPAEPVYLGWQWRVGPCRVIGLDHSVTSFPAVQGVRPGCQAGGAKPVPDDPPVAPHAGAQGPDHLHGGPAIMCGALQRCSLLGRTGRPSAVCVTPALLPLSCSCPSCPAPLLTRAFKCPFPPRAQAVAAQAPW